MFTNTFLEVSIRTLNLILCITSVLYFILILYLEITGHLHRHNRCSVWEKEKEKNEKEKKTEKSISSEKWTLDIRMGKREDERTIATATISPQAVRA